MHSRFFISGALVPGALVAGVPVSRALWASAFMTQQIGKLRVGVFGPAHNNGDLADGLNHFGAAGFAQGVDCFLASFAVLARHFDLDEFVVVQGAIQFFLEDFGEALVAHNNDGLQVVGNSPVFPALFR